MLLPQSHHGIVTPVNSFIYHSLSQSLESPESRIHAPEARRLKATCHTNDSLFHGRGTLCRIQLLVSVPDDAYRQSPTVCASRKARSAFNAGSSPFSQLSAR